MMNVYIHVKYCIRLHRITSHRIAPNHSVLKCIVPELYRSPCIQICIGSSYKGEMHTPSS
uniref:Uncharacterized protein n=1 Tax=Anguilla anguilla TaxID=7936 RepID=A0A0E9WF84_ANGAN